MSSRSVSTVHADIVLPAVSASVVEVELDEAISAITHARVVIATTADVVAQSLLSQRVTLSLVGRETTRQWALMVGQVALTEERAGARRFRLDLFDLAWKGSLNQNTRKFLNQTTEEIVTAVMSQLDVATEWRCSSPSPLRNYTVQYRESDLDFARRLLEHDGVYFSCDDQGRLVIADSSPLADDVAESIHPSLIDPQGALAADRTGIFELAHGARLRSGTATVNDYDWKTPTLSLVASAQADRDVDLEVYDYLVGYRSAERGAQLASLRVEQLQVGARYVSGLANAMTFAPALKFTLPDEDITDFEDGYLLTRVTHVFRNAGHVANDASYRCSFEAIPSNQSFRPALETPVPVMAGSHTAIVRGPGTEEIHTDEHGRFKAQFHWDRHAKCDDSDSRWIRAMQETASSMALARVGWEMSLSYVGGDPERPVGVARLINGKMVPTLSQPTHCGSMAMQSPSSPATGGFNELKLVDAAGGMGFAMRAEKDLVRMVKNDQLELIGHDELHVVGGMQTTTVSGQQSFAIAGNDTMSVNDSYALDLAGSRSKSVGGSERVDVAQSDSLNVAGSDDEVVGGLRLTITGSIGAPALKSVAKSAVPSPLGAAKGAIKGGFAGGAGGAIASLVPSPPSISSIAASAIQGGIFRAAGSSYTRMVGGAHISIAADNIASSSEGAHSTIVGGAKLTFAGEDITARATGPLTTSVGGALVRGSAGDMNDSSTTSTLTAGGALSVTASAPVELNGATITLTGLAGADLDGGGATISLTPGSITLGGDVALNASSSIVVSGGPIS